MNFSNPKWMNTKIFEGLLSYQMCLQTFFAYQVTHRCGSGWFPIWSAFILLSDELPSTSFNSCFLNRIYTDNNILCIICTQCVVCNLQWIFENVLIKSGINIVGQGIALKQKEDKTIEAYSNYLNTYGS